MKIIVAVVFVAILGALAMAGVFMLKGGRKTGQAGQRAMARALALRVGLSVALFIFILVSYLLGWIQPTGLPIR